MIPERHIYHGRRLLESVRERADGSFVAVIDEQVLGPFDTCRQATDALLSSREVNHELARNHLQSTPCNPPANHATHVSSARLRQ